MEKNEIKQKLEDKMVDVLSVLERKLDRNLPIPTIELIQMGSCAGKANSTLNKIKINPDFCHNGHWNEMLNVTLPHEIAHIVADSVYTKDYKKMGIPFHNTPHGSLWKSIMLMIGLPPKRCHNMGLENVKVRHRKHLPRPFMYQCSCEKIHYVTKIKHTRVQNGKYIYFRCRKCKENLVFIGTPDEWSCE